MHLDASQFLYGMRDVADIKIEAGQVADRLQAHLLEQVDIQEFYEQEDDNATFGMGYLGDDPQEPHEGGKAVAMTIASVVGMFIVQRVKRYVDKNGAAPNAAVARVSLEFE